MAEQENTQVNEAGPQNGEPPAEEARQQIVDQAGDIAAAYERARRELNEAVRSLRQEIARIDVNQARSDAQRWVDENPTLAVFLGIGAGIVAGRLLSSAFRPAPPPPLHVRARHRAGELTEQALGFAGGVGAVVAHQAAKAARQAGSAGASAAEQARVFGDELARRVQEASAALAERTGEWGDAMSETAHRSADALTDTAYDVRKAMKKKSKRVRKNVRKHGLADTVLDATRATVAAVAIKKVNDWVKRLT